MKSPVFLYAWLQRIRFEILDFSPFGRRPLVRFAQNDRYAVRPLAQVISQNFRHR